MYSINLKKKKQKEPQDLWPPIADIMKLERATMATVEAAVLLNLTNYADAVCYYLLFYSVQIGAVQYFGFRAKPAARSSRFLLA